MLPMAVLLIWCIGSIHAAADKPESPIKGNSTPDAGDYEVKYTGDIFYFQGEAYDDYQVNYEYPLMNMHIAVKDEKKCKSYIAYTKDFTIFYDCTKKGFGATRVMFATPEAHLSFNPNIYQEHAVLCKKRNLDQEEAISLIAASLPAMRQNF